MRQVPCCAEHLSKATRGATCGWALGGNNKAQPRCKHLCTNLCRGNTKDWIRKKGHCHVPFSGGSEGILFWLVVIIGLKLAFAVICHNVTLCRTAVPYFFFQYIAKRNSLGLPALLLTGLSVFTSQFWHFGNHLNRIHSETALKSVCCVNPSLEAYFNSAKYCSINNIGVLNGKY